MRGVSAATVAIVTEIRPEIEAFRAGTKCRGDAPGKLGDRLPHRQAQGRRAADSGRLDAPQPIADTAHPGLADGEQAKALGQAQVMGARMLLGEGGELLVLEHVNAPRNGVPDDGVDDPDAVLTSPQSPEVQCIAGATLDPDRCRERAPQELGDDVLSDAVVAHERASEADDEAVPSHQPRTTWTEHEMQGS
jgi:hypothetical protein